MGERERGRNGILFGSLERRRLMAGDVAAVVWKDALLLTGDEAGNSLVIQRGDDPSDRTTFRVTPTNGTTINGSAEPLVLAGVSNSMLIELRGGDDAVTLDNVRVNGTVTIDAGAGDDFLLVRSSRVTDHLVLRGGAGIDTLSVRKSTVQRDLHLDGGLGKDRFHLWTLDVQNRLNLSDTSGVSVVDLSHVTVDGPSYVRSGDSMDSLNVDVSTFYSTAVFTTKGQDDQVKMRGTVFFDEAPVIGGAGENAVDREVILSWDFRDGEQGWRAGFADIVVAQTDIDNPDDSPSPGVREAYRLRFGAEPLPEELDMPGTGYLLAGDNRTDEMFMYLFREIGPEHGLVAGEQYQATFTVRFASKVAHDAVGAGGSPSGDVFMKVGAVPRKPRIEVIPGADKDFVGINVDKGNQAQSGAEMSVAGDIANGDDTQSPLFPYRITHRKHTHPNAATTDAAGRLWLVTGTDSGSEVRTSLYYTGISVVLTPVE